MTTHARILGRIAGAATLFALLVACAPGVMDSGPGGGAPALAADRLLTDDGLDLPLRSWLPAEGRPPRAVVVALHGFNDYGNAFAMPGPWLAARGIAVYAYDQRGFGAAPSPGRWAGTGRLARDFAAATALVAQRHPEVPVFALGTSMGADVVLAALAGPDAPPVAGTLLVAPAVRGRAVMPGYQRVALWVAAHLVPWLPLTSEGLRIVPSDNSEMLRAFSADPLVIKRTRVEALWGLVGLMDEALAAAPALPGRALLLYGRRDEVIPAEGMRSLIERLPQSGLTVALYEDGYHMLLRDLQRETVWRDVASWIADPTAPLPSGADHAPRLAARH